MNKVENIQILRAIAALLVAFGLFEGTARLNMVYDRTDFPTGSGVDLFFIVSGFVMLLTSSKFVGRGAGGGIDFFLRRLIRIAPLYWACTLLYLCVNLISAHSVFTAPHIIASFLFIPFVGPESPGQGVTFPVFDLGWTLNYEMFFYVLFGLALLSRSASLITTASTALLATVIAGIFIPDSAVQLYYWTRPIILEFIIGMLIAKAFLAGVRLHWAVSLAGTGGAVVLLVVPPFSSAFISSADGTTLNDLGRLLSWGVPMGLLFSAAVLTKYQAGPSMKPLTAIGDASYSLYLLHPFVIIFMLQVWRAVPALNQYPAAFVAAGTTLAIIASLLSYRYFEQPVARILTDAMVRRRKARA